MAYKIFFTKEAKKELDNLDKKEKERVISKLILLNIPFPNFLDIKKLSGVDNFFRLRLGKIRIIFFIDNRLKRIIIRKIGFRKNVYLRLGV